MYKGSYIVLSIVCFLLFACDSESAWDCVKSPGSSISFEKSVGDFHSVVIQGHLDMVLIQDTNKRIKVETRKNLADGIRISNLDGMLFIEEKNSCSILRDRSYTTIYLHAPSLYNIRNASTGTIRNKGIWVQENLGLVADNYQESAYYNNGSFQMHMQVDNLQVLANGNSVFELQGTADKAIFSFYSGNARLEAETFKVKDIEVHHRGNNHMMLYPTQSIVGQILNTGDVRAYNKPENIEVEELYRGRLIFVE